MLLGMIAAGFRKSAFWGFGWRAIRAWARVKSISNPGLTNENPPRHLRQGKKVRQ
jgi:hypothetical protein